MGLLLPGGMKYEPGIAAQVRRWVGPGQMVVDVGASIGLHTLLAAHLVGPRGRVHCFEPDPQSAQYLLDNIRLNGLDQVTPWSLALSDSDGSSELHLDHKAARTTSLLPNWELPYERHDRQQLRVGTARLDSLALGPVHFLKIDVEGSEGSVLAGGRATIAGSRPVVLIEVFGADGLQDVVSFFDELDYEVVDAETGSPPGPAGSYSGNLLGAPL
jgi:FkbM family methyltransferase